MYNIKYNNGSKQKNEFQNKIYFFIILFLFTFFILIIRIGNIQIVKNWSYSIQTKKNTEKTIRVPPIRGLIYSSDNQLLAYNNTSFNLYITPNELYSNPEFKLVELNYIANVINFDSSELEKIVSEKKRNKEDILIKENIPFSSITKIEENMDNLPGITIKESLYRVYPFKNLLAHVLGYTGPISSNEFAVKQKDGYIQSDVIGKNGIENSYEDELRGKEGRKVFAIDAKMIIQNEINSKEIKPLPGNELELTINFELQKNVEDILADRAGTIIVAKPSNGEILAMVSFPDYDPNIFILSTDENIKEKRKFSLDTKGTPLINRNIQSIYPAASIFKLVSSTAILNENILSTQERFFCPGYFNLGNENFLCWVYPANHGWENLEEGIMNSCDVYFYNASLKVGPDRIHQYAISYGFGNLLGIDLPYERQGLIPSVQWMKSQGQTWHPGHTLITAIGQGDVKVTPLQIANFMSVFCNKGYSYRPHILKSIRSSFDGSIIKQIEKEKIISLENKYDKSVFDFIYNALRNVVVKGTASGAFFSNKLKIAGKTGTAEVGIGQDKQVHSWFAGFGPIDYPLDEQIVVVVLIEYENNNYLRFAAPIASMVFNSWFNKENFEQSANRLWYPIRKTYN